MPWILGAIGLFVVLGFGGCLLLVALGSSAPEEAPAPVVTVAAQPKVETPAPQAPLDASTGTVKSATPTSTGLPTPRPPLTATTTRPAPTSPFGTPTAPTSTSATPPPFSRSKAQAEVDRVAQTVSNCKRVEGPFGIGTIRVDFEPDGRVGTLSRPPFAGTPEGSCISGKFLSIRIGAFSGSTQQIEKSFIIQQ